MNDFLQEAFNYYYVSHQVWGKVNGQIKNDSRNQLQLVTNGTRPMDAAGRAATWLHEHDKRLTQLNIVAHGGPGSFTLGVDITKDNVAPLGGWLASFFDGGIGTGIQILGCQCAADSVQTINGANIGQVHPADRGLSRRGYLLLLELANASRQKVEAGLNEQSIDPLGLKSMCRRVFPGGNQSFFNGKGISNPTKQQIDEAIKARERERG